MIILSHPTGNANVRAAASGLNNAGILKEFHTSFACFPRNLLDKLSKIGPLAEIGRRSYDPALAPLTKMWPWLEIGRLLAIRMGIKSLIQHETGPFSVDASYQGQDKRTSLLIKTSNQVDLRGIYAYEDGALNSFSEAKRQGLLCFYDLPIGYWKAAQRLLEPEIKRWPEWVSTLTGFSDSKDKLSDKNAELEMADCIFVASTFTANTLKDYPGKLPEIKIIPYGFPEVGPAREYTFHKEQRKLKLLFVGGLSQRKGIADLFAVVDELRDKVELTVVGNKSVNDCPALDAALAKNHFIPGLPHAEVLELMRGYDVFVFPSLFEGFGLVITEAMSQGTPVLTTERTAGPDLIEHGKNGWLVKAGSTKNLKDAIVHLLDHPEEIAEAGRLARETAKARPWALYGKELSEAVGSIINLQERILS
jgi:glycosyltransferase involved in cell wall biosynthesis